MAQPQPDDDFDRILRAIIAAYVNAEAALLGGVASILRFTAPEALAQLIARSRIDRLAQRVARELGAGTPAAIDRLLDATWRAGTRSGELEVRRVARAAGTDVARIFDFSVPHGERALAAIRYDLTSELEDVRRRITRLPEDIYKLISPVGAGGQVLGIGYSPAQAQAVVWREYVRQGVTGFQDRSGRNWSLSAYVEMSVRTATLRAFNTSHLEVMQAAHIDLFTVDSDGHPCPLCLPWQHQILSVEPDERADATIAEATAAGLFHPNCKHSLRAYIPGVTQLSPPEKWTPEHQRLYDLTQKQRRLELEIRKAKRALEYAITPEAQRDAALKVRRAQKNMRAFITESGLLRQSRREQVDLANSHLTLPAA